VGAVLFFFLDLLRKILSNTSERFQKIDLVLGVIHAGAKVIHLGAVGDGAKPLCHLADDTELAMTWQPPWRRHQWRHRSLCRAVTMYSLAFEMKQVQLFPDIRHNFTTVHLIRTTHFLAQAPGFEPHCRFFFFATF
jgi:hypothetical protein